MERAIREKEIEQRKRPWKVPYLIGMFEGEEKKERTSGTGGRGSAALFIIYCDKYRYVMKKYHHMKHILHHRLATQLKKISRLTYQEF